MNKAELGKSLTLALLLLTTACQTLPDSNHKQAGKPSVETIWAGLHCSRERATPAATWIDNSQQLEASFNKIRSATLGGKSSESPQIDFNNEIAILVEMGQHPTLGYRIALPEPARLEIGDDRIDLTLDWRQPSPDAFLAQVTSSPCLLLRLERGNYHSVQILDEEESLRVIARMKK